MYEQYSRYGQELTLEQHNKQVLMQRMAQRYSWHDAGVLCNCGAMLKMQPSTGDEVKAADGWPVVCLKCNFKGVKYV